ncbi:MAG TPA: family 1 glycosylhydrolase [Cellulomonas sp.]
MVAPRLAFPDGFWWGASTAAHQIEGNNVNSDWWAREHAPVTDVPEPSGDAADSYHRFREDIALLAGSGLRMYRFSIEWARIEPEDGFFSRAELLHYRSMIDACRAHGVEPMVTLHHFTHPRWFARLGGWRNPQAPELFARYVQHVLPILRDVTWVCTINEPNMVVMTRGEEGTDMAAASLPAPDLEISHALVDAHRRARQVLADGLPQVRSGWAVATQAFHAMPGCEAETRAYGYPREDFFLENAAGDDWLGVQAYLRTFIGKDGPVPVRDDVEKTLTGWEYFPPALGIGVRHAWELSGHVPVLVTENGLATSDDTRRIDYTYDALAGLRGAMDDGVEVLGYLHWSLLDNYEWGSFRPTFGLVGWDAETFERSPRPSLGWLGAAARTGAVVHPTR